MKQLAAFLLPAARPAMALWSLLILGLAGLLVLMLKDPDFPVTDSDVVFASAFMFPAAIGLLCGLVVQELQHCSFVWPLPGIRWKTALGFTLVGSAFTLFFVVIPNLGSTHGRASLFVLGITAYFLGSVAIDPILPGVWIAMIGITLCVMFYSAPMGAYWADNQALAMTLGALWIAISLRHKFSKATFRRMPFVPVVDLPGTFAAKHAARTEREKLGRRGPRDRSWMETYLGTDDRRWVRAASYESFGALGWRDLPRLLDPLGWIPLILILEAMLTADYGEWLPTFSTNLYQGIFMPPVHVDGLSYHLVAIWVCILGFRLTLARAPAIDPGRQYPLSRHDLSRITFRYLLDFSWKYGLIIIITLIPLGLIAAWSSGVTPRLDFIPLVVRAAIITVIFLPIPQWIRLYSGWYKPEREIPFQIFVAIPFVIFVAIWSVVSPTILRVPLQELAFLVGLFIGVQIIFRRKLEHHFATDDLI